MQNIYITSGIRGEGKTFLSAGIAATMQSLGYSTCVYKPIQTGAIEVNGFMQSPDITFVKTIDPYIKTRFLHLFKSKSDPLIAAEAENEYIDSDAIVGEYARIQTACESTIIDGDSGLLSPIASGVQNVDLIRKLQVPVLFVITPREDAINDTLLAIYAAQEKGVEIRGVVINNITDNCPKERLTAITRVVEEYSSVNILGLVPHIGNKIAPEELISAVLNGVDIESVFNVKINKLDFD